MRRRGAKVWVAAVLLGLPARAGTAGAPDAALLCSCGALHDTPGLPGCRVLYAGS